MKAYTTPKVKIFALTPHRHLLDTSEQNGGTLQSKEDVDFDSEE